MDAKVVTFRGDEWGGGLDNHPALVTGGDGSTIDGVAFNKETGAPAIIKSVPRREPPYAEGDNGGFTWHDRH